MSGNYFGHLLKQEGISEAATDTVEDEKDYPGHTLPVNRPGSNRAPGRDRMLGAKCKLFLINGTTMEFYTIGDIAKAVGRKAVTLRSWETKGILPLANYRTPPPHGDQLPGKEVKGRRLYTVDQAMCLLDAVEMFSLDNKARADWPGFKQHLATEWPL